MGGVGGVQGECERRFEVFVKMQKKFRGWGSGSGEGLVWGVRMDKWEGGQGGCGRRSDVFVKNKKKMFSGSGGWGSGWGGGGSGWM